MKKPLDFIGVSVIDFQNNGSPGAFAGLARTFGIPWILICDNDTGREQFIRQLKARGFSETECTELFRPLPGKDVKLESFLFDNGFEGEYRQIISDRNIPLTSKEGTAESKEEILPLICGDKTGYTTSLIEKLRETGASESRVPQFFEAVIKDIIAKATL